MRTDSPSRTAWSAAVHRAVHQRAERGGVFADPFAVAVTGLGEDQLAAEASREHRRGMRLMVAARSRLADEVVRSALAEGVRQVVLLGTGLDTTALRLAAEPTAEGLRVFETDHPATLAWRERAFRDNGLTSPEFVTPVGLDFEERAWPEALRDAGFDEGRPAVVLWLGVLVYLTRETVEETVGACGRLAATSRLVFDYAVPPAMRAGVDQAAHDSRAERLATLGEPWLTFLTPPEVADLAAGAGLDVTNDVDVATYLGGSTPSAARLVVASVPDRKDGRRERPTTHRPTP